VAEVAELHRERRAARDGDVKRALAAQAAELSSALAARDAVVAEMEIAHAGAMYGLKAGRIRDDSHFVEAMRRQRHEQEASLRGGFSAELAAARAACRARVDELEEATKAEGARRDARARGARSGG
jgi:hypothetical protein